MRLLCLLPGECCMSSGNPRRTNSIRRFRESRWRGSYEEYCLSKPPVVIGERMSSEERSLNKIYIEQLLFLLSKKERETIVLWSQGYKPPEIAKLISDKYEKRLIKPHTIVLRISKILKKLRKISANHS